MSYAICLVSQDDAKFCRVLVKQVLGDTVPWPLTSALEDFEAWSDELCVQDLPWHSMPRHGLLICVSRGLYVLQNA